MAVWMLEVLIDQFCGAVVIENLWLKSSSEEQIFDLDNEIFCHCL